MRIQRTRQQHRQGLRRIKPRMFMGMAAVTSAAGGCFSVCEVLLFCPCSFTTSAASRVHTSKPATHECCKLCKLNSETISTEIT
jgi:hypothetical protein